MQAFRLSERSVQPGCCEIRVEGELDMAVADQLEEAVHRAASEHEQILIGLQDCEFIDSTGIAVIVQAHTEMAKQGRRVVACGASNQVLRVLSITGLTDNGLTFADVDGALAALNRSA